MAKVTGKNNEKVMKISNKIQELETKHTIEIKKLKKVVYVLAGLLTISLIFNLK